MNAQTDLNLQVNPTFQTLIQLFPVGRMNLVIIYLLLLFCQKFT